MIMERHHLPLFLMNTLLILVDVSIGYHLVPGLLAREGEPETAGAL